MNDYLGMTVNERLFAAGIDVAWDRAVKSEDREKLKELLKLVDLEPQASTIIDAAILRWQFDKPKLLRYQELMRQQSQVHRK